MTVRVICVCAASPEAALAFTVIVLVTGEGFVGVVVVPLDAPPPQPTVPSVIANKATATMPSCIVVETIFRRFASARMPTKGSRARAGALDEGVAAYAVRVCVLMLSVTVEVPLL